MGGSTALFFDGLKGPDSDDEGVQLPARDVSENLSDKGLYVAGALVAADFLPNHPLTWGMPERTVVFSWGSPIFRTSIPILDTDRRVIAVHPEEKIVVSGYVEKAELLAERPVAVWLRWGKGQLALFGFNPQYRASTPVTYKLLFNAMLLPEVGRRAMTAEPRLVELIAQSRRAVIFTGAGLSTGSGIADYRGPDGVWKTREPVMFRDFMERRDARVEYWDQKLETWPMIRDAEPNAAHLAIARWQAAGVGGGRDNPEYRWPA